MWLALWLACAPAPKTEVTPDPADTAAVDLERQLVFAVLADPHVTGEGEQADRLRDVVDWIDSHQQSQPIELLFLLGDVAWGDGMELVPTILDFLPIPWVPLRGDNELQAGEEERFYQVFAPQRERLAAELQGWRMAPVPVHDPANDWTAWIDCFGFEHGGLTFLALDWTPRSYHPVYGEMADLNDFEGGTLPWLRQQLATLPDGLDERVVMLSHQPMMPAPGGFDLLEWDEVIATTDPVHDAVWANLAGHLHGDIDDGFPEAGFDLHVHDATWDDDNTFRIYSAWSDGEKLSYTWEIVRL